MAAGESVNGKLDDRLELYEAPEWGEALDVKPTCRFNFSMRPTPIHRWNLPGVPPEFKVSVKREDLTGSACSGNKIRKLDFLLGEAVRCKCDCVVTIGGVGSNHARATAIAARQLGLDSHLFLFTKSEGDVSCKGNYLLHRISGANIYLLPASALSMGLPAMIDIVTKFGEKLRSEGHNPFVIAPGGCSPLGSWGYIDAWQEFMEQGVLEDFDDIILAAGSTGCVCGLAVANYLTGSKVRVHGVTVANSVEDCYSIIARHLEKYGLQVEAGDVVNIIGGYVGDGYGKATEDDFRFIMDVMSATGIPLDPDFTVKCVKGMLSEMRERPQIFKGRRVLYVHTGGIFGLFDGRIEDLAATTATNRVKMARDVLPELKT